MSNRKKGITVKRNQLVNRFIEFSRRRKMFTRKGLIYLCVTAWLIAGVEAYKSDCKGGYCFVITDVSNNNEFLYQSNAQQWCQSNGAHLVEIKNQSIQTSLTDFIRSVYSQGVNGWNVFTNGKRSSGGPWIRLNGNSIGSLTIYEQPYVSDAYVYLKSTNSGFDLFASRPAETKGGFICTGLYDCSGGITIGGQCYKSFSEKLSWFDARNRCLDKGEDLAIFEYVTTNAGFNALNGSWISASTNYWIGIRRESWTWQSSTNSPDSDVKYSNWISGQPTSGSQDCLCLSTPDWKWTACTCNQYSPFVCITADKNTTSTSTRTASTTTKTSTSTAPSTRTTPSVASGSGGVFSASVPPTVTSNSISPGNTSGIMDQSMGLSREAAIGIGVGVGVGGALVIVALVVVIIIFSRKRSSFRCPQRRTTHAKSQPPDILMKNPVSNDHRSDGIENPYARIVSDNSEASVGENVGQSPTVYAELGFCTEPQLHRVSIVPGKTKPSSVSTSPTNNSADNHFTVGGDLYAEVTKA